MTIPKVPTSTVVLLVGLFFLFVLLPSGDRFGFCYGVAATAILFGIGDMLAGRAK